MYIYHSALVLHRGLCLAHGKPAQKIDDHGESKHEPPMASSSPASVTHTAAGPPQGARIAHARNQKPWDIVFIDVADALELR